jgi:hypothetical protein
MEMVAACFEPSFRKKLYPRISRLQDIMGNRTFWPEAEITTSVPSFCT